MPPRSTRRSKTPKRDRRFLPGTEVAERRLLMSATAAATRLPLVVAVLGDSLSDEYQFTGPPDVSTSSGSSSLVGSLQPDVAVSGLSSARNWVEELAAIRPTEVTFGGFTTASRGPTRNQGFAEDWAQVGAVAAGGSNSLTAQLVGERGKSLPGLLTQTRANSGYRPRDVDAVAVEVGANDYLGAVVADVLSGGKSGNFVKAKGAKLDPINAEVEGAIQSAVGRIHRQMPRARVVVVAPPDIAATPQVASTLAGLAGSVPGLPAAIAKSTRALAADLARFARGHRVGLVNTQELLDQRVAQPTVGGVAVDVSASGQDYTDGFVGDGFHPGTILQGTLAQAIVDAIDAQFHRTAITPVADAEIAAYARSVQPEVTLARSPSAAGVGVSTLTATVDAGQGGIATPTGPVTFATIVPATSDSVAHFGVTLGVAPLDSSGVATLDVDDAALAGSEVVAAYGGDPGHAARISTGLVAPGTTPPFAP